MDFKEIDKLLNETLSPKECPSKDLNDKILKQMKESGVMNIKNRKIIIAACIAICVLLLPTSIYAAYLYLLPKEVANELGDKKLSKAFEEQGQEDSVTITDGNYKATYLGYVTGELISERTGSAWEIFPERTYVAIAIEKSNDEAMTNEDALFVSPLIQGLKPWQFNIATMNGSYIEKIIDGVLYRILEFDNIEWFADRELYLIVSDTPFFSNEAYHYDEDTGFIASNENYMGTNILFQLKVDSSKANKNKADSYIKELEVEWNSSSDQSNRDNAPSINEENIKDENDITIKQEEEDEIIQLENGISLHFKGNEKSTWWANDTSSETVLGFDLKVEGEGIKLIHYTLDRGEFCYYPRDVKERKYYGKELTIPYAEQNKDFQYSIYFKAEFSVYGYSTNDIRNLGQKNMNERNQLFFQLLKKEVESTHINLEIEMEDGSRIEKSIRFHNLIDDREARFQIEIEVD